MEPEKKESSLTEITEKEFKNKLLQAKNVYLEDIEEYTKLYQGIERLFYHLAYLQSNAYKIKYFINKDGELNYSYKEKEPVGFRSNK